ncbi:MAG: orotidine-5'-phosphate decarboxylase [Bacteroidetes bacterium]|nr:orotidine-5'-phosphate decarboxylase [Bacteroidota bacterium]
MDRTALINSIKTKRSFLCIGLDTDLSKIPQHLLKEEDPAFEFNRQIIDATHDLAVAYKPNLAFYECNGIKGWQSLTRTIQYLKQFDVFTIADAKRGDIGNTSTQYAKTFFNPSDSGLDFDAVTVAPYMGEDSVKPFLEFPGKWVILLALTSNKGANDFQLMVNKASGIKVFEEVLLKSRGWGSPDNMMYVVGATKAEMLTEVRRLVPDHFLLVPGVGAQGGSLQEVAKFGLTKDCGLLVNSSRNIIYASKEIDFAEKAREEAARMQLEMEEILIKIF